MENKYAYIAWELQKIWWIILRGNEVNSTDLDVFCEKVYLKNVERFLSEQWFTKTFKNEDFIYYKKFVEWYILFVDITLNLGYFLKNIWNVRLNLDFQRKYLQNVDKYNLSMNVLRYLFLFRNWEKYRNYFLTNKVEILQNNFFLSYIEPEIVKKKVIFSELDFILSKKMSVLLKYFWILRILKMFFFSIKNKIKNYRLWKIVVFLWIDWVWKTTIISELEKKIWAKQIYFWEGNYKTKRLSDKILSKTKNKIVILFFKFLLLFENIYRIKIAYFYKLRWRIVLLDRHPYFDWLSRGKKDFHFLFTKIFYSLFSKWDKVCILFNDPEIIFKRKQEKTISQIETYYNILFKIKIKNWYKIKNDVLPDTLNTILKIIYEK